MTQRNELAEEAMGLPEHILAEVLDFVRFLKARLTRERFETAIASEPVLAKDWLRPEEDEAWKNL